MKTQNDIHVNIKFIFVNHKFNEQKEHQSKIVKVKMAIFIKRNKEMTNIGNIRNVKDKLIWGEDTVGRYTASCVPVELWLGCFLRVGFTVQDAWRLKSKVSCPQERESMFGCRL